MSTLFQPLLPTDAIPADPAPREFPAPKVPDQEFATTAFRTARCVLIDKFSLIYCNFNLQLATLALLLLLFSVIGCRLALIETNLADRIVLLLIQESIVLPIPIYWQWRHRPDLRDSSMVALWTFVFAAILPYPLLIAARVHMPLRDPQLASIDAAIGVTACGVMRWAQNHYVVAAVLDGSYALLRYLVVFTVLACALSGKLKSAREFLLANLLAFALVIPLVALLPAIGPWNQYLFAPNLDQRACQSEILSLRLPGTYVFNWQSARIVCFPSFHVIWAVLCARALWAFRALRVPVALLSTLIIVATMTTGWHYFSDVLAGLIIAAICIFAARRFTALNS